MTDIGNLLDVVSMTRDEGSFGTSSYGIDTPGLYINSTVYDICTPNTSPDPLTGSHPIPSGNPVDDTKANVFAVETEFHTRAMRSPGDEESTVRNALDVESEKAAAVKLWGNSGDGIQVSMFGPGVQTVATGANFKESITKAVEKFWAIATGVGYSDTIIHLGLEAFLDAAQDIKVMTDTLGVKVAVSFGYPLGAVGVTGPVAIRFGPDAVVWNVDPHDNSNVAQASRLGAIEFDPTIAVRVS